MILPKPMTYAQILAGGVSFQLYNKSTNAVVPTSVSDGGGYIEITEDATSDHNTIYKIDQFVGAVSEITLYTEGDSAKTYALLGASQNEDVISVRSFQINRTIASVPWQIVTVEINGKMYIPYTEDGGDKYPVNYNLAKFKHITDLAYIDSNSVFPLVKVILADDLADGYSSKFTIPEFRNVQVKADDTIEVSYTGDYKTQAPWRFGQDGIFNTGDGAFLRVNGINRAIIWQNEAVSVEDLGMSLHSDTGNIYEHPDASLIASVDVNGDPADYKRGMQETFGIEFGQDILVAENINGENIQPFVFLN